MERREKMKRERKIEGGNRKRKGEDMGKKEKAKK
jgi:hypothetical protein